VKGGEGSSEDAKEEGQEYEAEGPRMLR
jgi:hypothetical protein